MTEKREISHSAAEVRQFDYDHWLTALFAQEELREALFAILAFNVELSRVRETVSEPMLGDIRLQWWREAISGLEKNSLKAHPIIDALNVTNKQRPLDFSLMQEMIDMRAKDLDPTPIADDNALMAYLDGTGGALHRLMVPVLGGSGRSENLEAANQAGRSFALAGITRAIPFHAGHDLVLLPISRLDEFGLTRYTVFQEEHRANFLKIVHDLTIMAENELKDARKMARNSDRDVKPAHLINALTAIYLKRMKAAHFDPGHPKLSVGSQRKILGLYLRSLQAG